MGKVWGYTVRKVEITQEQKRELFKNGASSYGIEHIPKEIKELEEGYYMIVETGDFFSIENHMLEKYNIHVHNVKFGFKAKNVLIDYIHAVSDIKEQKKLGEILAEITVFNNDLDTPLEFSNGVATMKPYFHKSIKILNHDDGSNWYSLFVNDVEIANVVYNEDMNQYSSYDGVDGCGWYDNIKEAVKSFMNSNYRYPTDEEYYEPSCSNCGDGGCIHCEPHRFI